MGLFVNIKTVFPETTRDLSSLKAVYEDKEKLFNLIDKVAREHLTITVIKGKRVLLKPNWVLHSKNEEDEWCLRTHDSFLLGALDYVLRLKPKEVLIGDAPIQGCHWSKMVNRELIDAVVNLSEKYKIPVAIKDFRRVHFDQQLNNVIEEKEPLDNFVIFDVGKKVISSLLRKKIPISFV